MSIKPSPLTGLKADLKTVSAYIQKLIISILTPVKRKVYSSPLGLRSEEFLFDIFDKGVEIYIFAACNS